jgi:hypothetical protein
VIFSDEEVFAGLLLILQAMRSPNYVAGVSGWSINKDGSAEFNNITIRGGSVLGGDVLLYNGTPAAGTLYLSLSQAGGTDPYGNTYPQGEALFDLGTGQVVARVTPAFSAYGGGFWTKGFQAPNNIYSILQGGILRFGGDSFASNQEGTIQWLADDGTTGYTEMILSSGKWLTTDTPAWIELHPKSPLRTRPQVKVKDNASGRVDFSVSGNVTVNAVDTGAGIQAQTSITANVTGITTTQVALMTVPSETYVDGRAYRVTVWGLLQSTTADTYGLFEIHKGTLAGTTYKGQMRVPVVNGANVNSVVSFNTVFLNQSGADITTALVLSCSVAAGTGIFAASSGNVAYMTVEDVGLATAWPGQPIT